MVVLAEVLAAMERWYPAASAESWDSVGLTCGDPAADVSAVLLAVDCVPATVTEALNGGYGLLITHHPLLLSAVHSVPASDPKGQLVHRLIRGSTAHFAAHTNADIAEHGVSEALAARLGLTDSRPIVAAPDNPRVGTGRIGTLAHRMPLRQFLDVVAECLPPTLAGVRAAGDRRQHVSTVAVCGGSGGGFAQQAAALGADVLVTADLRHHPVLEAVSERAGLGGIPMALIDAAHWATEAPWLDLLAGLLRAEFGGALRVTVSGMRTDPWTMHAC